jgi:glyoxylase-like metal-dependent hydrolase (beta-lactamase superfamily II)
MIPGTPAAFKLITDRTTRIKPGAEIVSGIGTVESRGHTPGHMFILIASNGEQALVIGDAITNQLISFAHPDWKPSYGFLTGQLMIAQSSDFSLRDETLTAAKSAARNDNALDSSRQSPKDDRHWRPLPARRVAVVSEYCVQEGSFKASTMRVELVSAQGRRHCRRAAPSAERRSLT